MSSTSKCIPLPFSPPPEIFPASYLSHRTKWQDTRQSLPENSWLMVTNPQNRTQSRFLLQIGNSFRRSGATVFVLPMSPQSVQTIRLHPMMLK